MRERCREIGSEGLVDKGDAGGNKVASRIFLAVSFLTAATLVILSSCGLSGNPTVTGAPALETEEGFSLVSSSPVSTSCLPVTPMSTPTPVKARRLIYVLIDRSGSYEALTELAVDMVEEVLSDSDNLWPGDKVYLGWVGSDVEFIIQREVGIVPTPLITPFPPLPTPHSQYSPPISPCPLPTPQGGVSKLWRVQATKTAWAILAQCTVEVTRARATATAAAQRFAEVRRQTFCEQQEVNEYNYQVYEQWRQRQRERRERVAEEIGEALSSLEIVSTTETHLYESLYVAARVISRERATSEFASYNLVIFSDMEDAGSVAPTSLDFTGVRVLMALVRCQNMLECQHKEEEWRTRFSEWGASEVQLITEPEMVPELLEVFLDDAGNH